MIENGIINRLQFWFLTANFTVGSALLLIPTGIISQAKQDAWIAMLLAIVLGAGIQYIMISLATLYPDKSLIRIIEYLLGKPLGKMIGILYAWFFLHLSALVIRNAVDLIKAVIMPETPMLPLSLMAGILIYIAIYHGIEAVGRSNELFTPVAIIGFWLTILLVAPLMKGENIQPILAEGLAPVIKGAYPMLGFPYAELIVFLMFIPFLNSKKEIKKIFITAGMVGGFSLLVGTLSSVLVLDANLAGITLYSTYSMARLINIADFLTRLESVISLSILVTIFAKIEVSFYGGILALAQVFNLPDYRTIIAPLVIIVVTLSIILDESIIEEQVFAITTWTPYGLLFGFVIPLILLILSWFRKKA